jgi:hypothetical protein
MGIQLAALTASLLSVTTGSTASPSVHVQTSSTVLTGAGTAVTPQCANAVISAASIATNVVTGTTSGPTDIQSVTIYNNSGFAESLTIKHVDGTNTVTLWSGTLGIGYTLSYEEGSGWRVLDANGNIQQGTTLQTGRFLKRTVILNGTTSFTTQAATTSIVARLQAAGAGGGGCPATVGGDGGGGGGGGGYAEWVVAVTGSTVYTCSVGAGGTGTSAGEGNNGGNTTLTIGGTTCTANGGQGGPEGNATTGISGGAGGSISTNGTVNLPGQAGGNSLTGWSGVGGDSILGFGGPGKDTSGTGNVGAGFGGGGGGGYNTTAVAETGGGGANGVIIIDEYS